MCITMATSLALQSSSASSQQAADALRLKDHYQSVLAYRERYGVN